MRFPYFVLAGVLATAVALPIIGAAQQTPGAAPPALQSGAVHGGHRHHGMMAALRQLNLSQNQQTQIKTLITNFHQAHPKGSPPDRQAMQQLHQQVMAVLTPDQQKQLQGILAAQHQQRQTEDPNGPFRPDPSPSPSPSP